MSEVQTVVLKQKVLKLDDAACSCCKADFLKNDLDNQGRCPTCSSAGLLPGMKQKQEMVHTNAKPTREELKALIREVLEELQEPRLAAKACAKCKSEFVPSFPAEKFCPTCREIK